MAINNAQVLYRGQKGDDFRLNEAGLFWVTPDLNYASDPHYGGQDGATVFSVHIDSSKLFDYELEEHKKMLLAMGRSPTYRSAANGNFRALAEKEVVTSLKFLNFNGFKAIEPEGQPSIAVFDTGIVTKATTPDLEIDKTLFSEGKRKVFAKYVEQLIVERSSRQIQLALKGRDNTVLGYIAAYKELDNTYSVSSVIANKGFGTFMYAFAAMALSSNDAALVPATNGNTNSAARRVWDSLEKKGFEKPLRIAPSQLYRSIAISADQEHEKLFKSGLEQFEKRYDLLKSSSSLAP